MESTLRRPKSATFRREMLVIPSEGNGLRSKRPKLEALEFRERLRVNGVKGDVFCLLARILLPNTESFPDTQNKG